MIRPAFLVLCLLLAGCGVRGPLYLPGEPEAGTAAEPGPQPAEQEEEDDEDGP